MVNLVVTQVAMLLSTLLELNSSNLALDPKSLWRTPAVGDFYGTEIEIWAGFGPVGITEKNRL